MKHLLKTAVRVSILCIAITLSASVVAQGTACEKIGEVVMGKVFTSAGCEAAKPLPRPHGLSFNAEVMKS